MIFVALVFPGTRRAVPLEFVASIREKRRGTRATGVIALVYRRRDVYVRVHRRGGRLIYETCIDRRAVCIRWRARKWERPGVATEGKGVLTSRLAIEEETGEERKKKREEERCDGRAMDQRCSVPDPRSAPVQKRRRFFKQIKVASKKSTSHARPRRMDERDISVHRGAGFAHFPYSRVL